MICVKLSLENHDIEEVLQVSKNGRWGNSKLNPHGGSTEKLIDQSQTRDG